MYKELVESSRICATGYNGNCDGCIFCGKSNDNDGDCYQQLHKAAVNAIEELQKRVPKRPHGRLVDADKLMQEMRLFIKENMLSRDDARELLETIKDAPTIIPAEPAE